MTKYDEAWVAEEQAKRAFLAEKGMYAPDTEHDNCGVGLVVSIDGKPSRQVVQAGITALKAIWHRGAVDADGKTGDGAGIHVQIPVQFFYDQIRRTGHEPNMERLMAVGQVFLPRTNFNAQETCRTIVEAEVLRMGYSIYGWRHVPVDIDCLGEKANATRPEIEQIILSNSKGVDEETFERELYVIRRRIEKEATRAGINDLYICSLSCRSIIYKGMMLAEQVSEFYPDLMDPRFESAFAIYHQRYSTNTFPQWWLAQPFRMLAHNGEINTLKGNLNWMKSHEIRMASSTFGELAEDIKPIVRSGSSDSAALDAVFEVLVRAGRSAPMAKTMLVPETWAKQAKDLPDAWVDMYSYCNSVMEPWDGPAALAMTDGRWVCGGLDRNGLRPMRYVVTGDGLLIAGSEAGMVPFDEGRVREKGALGPGQLIAVDMKDGKLYHDREIKDRLAASQPFGDWVGKINDLSETLAAAEEVAGFSGEELRRRQVAAGYTMEELEQILAPMAEDGKEAIASMGDDTPPAVLSDKYRPLSHYFRQNFSQVTNPPIDSLREFRVMSLKTRFGNLKNVLDEDSSQTEILVLESPFLGNAQFEELKRNFNAPVVEIDCTFPADSKPNALQKGLTRIREEAEDAVRSGAGHIILTDHLQGPDKVAMPMILATSAVHSWLTRTGLRTFTSICVRSAECIDAHYFAVLIGAGATVVNAYLAEDSLADRIDRGLLDGPLSKALARYRAAIDAGLLKIMAKMGISVISSYRGGLNFEAVGLSRAMCAEYFPGMHSRISGIGVTGIQRKLEDVHARGWRQPESVLPIGGFYKARRSGETHAWEAQAMHMLQAACDKASFEIWKQYSAKMRSAPPIHLRDLLDIKPIGKPVPLEEVESITSIRKRFVTPGMSLGALGPEAHKTLNVAMNRIGAKSDSGEGGEDPAHFVPEPNGDNPSAKIKQVASGRFGVTAEYLNNCEELEIKIAQGAKPGEGGQIPGMKVTALIARLRHSTPGVGLISPPPHHDIYSIEDLKQLIFDLKRANPAARVHVKLVSQSGIGAVAAGTAKALADVILVSGHDGGTGASPLNSLKHAGTPWELGLAETQQTLMLNDMRDRVVVQADGQLKTGRDVIIAALLGAEEFGFATTALVVEGCIMMRVCHLDTCPVGVATQNPVLRSRFTGKPEFVVNFMQFLAQEVREYLAELGFRSLDEAIGRNDLLDVNGAIEHWKASGLDLTPILDGPAFAPDAPRRHARDQDHELEKHFDVPLIEQAQDVIAHGGHFEVSLPIRNTERAVGTMLGNRVTLAHGEHGLPAGTIEVNLTGSAGQSFGAFLPAGITLRLEGDSNDYVGKGLSGGQIVVRPPRDATFDASQNVIAGNVIGYGATQGSMFLRGVVGERFLVRNSGATAVVEGVGDHALEYMTGGLAVILGATGRNLGAGMSGGTAYVYRLDRELVNREALASGELELLDLGSGDVEILRDLIERHVAETGSTLASALLDDFEAEALNFVRVLPRDYAAVLQTRQDAAAEGLDPDGDVVWNRIMEVTGG